MASNDKHVSLVYWIIYNCCKRFYSKGSYIDR